MQRARLKLSRERCASHRYHKLWISRIAPVTQVSRKHLQASRRWRRRGQVSKMLRLLRQVTAHEPKHSLKPTSIDSIRMSSLRQIFLIAHLTIDGSILVTSQRYVELCANNFAVDIVLIFIIIRMMTVKIFLSHYFCNFLDYFDFFDHGFIC